MPSGDAFQSAHFVAFLYCLGVDLRILVLFHVGVCFGRVYFMCHWFADTIVATFLGIFIGKMLLLAYETGNFSFISEYTL